MRRSEAQEERTNKRFSSSLITILKNIFMPEKIELNILKKILPGDDILSQCIHCGMCLTTCPTYDLTKMERSSPRGRIKLINSVAKGELPVTAIFADEMNFCLDCQACETACPAGVQYGIMVETARVLVDEAKIGNAKGRFIKRFILKNIVASKRNLKFVARLLLFYQESGLQATIRRFGIIKLISKKLAAIEKLTPVVFKTFSDEIITEIYPAKGEKKYKVAFLTGCLMNIMFADINTDTVEVLSAFNCEVITPKQQVCCGSLNAHNGDIKTAIKLAKKNIDVFAGYEYDYLISNSAGCGAFMKQYGHFLKDDEQYSEKAKLFSNKVKDVTEFLAENDFDVQLGAVNETITYHDACHLAHSQKITTQPRKVLKSIPGIIVKDLNESAWCCGSAGIYNVTRYDDSMKILDKKMKNIIDSEAKIVVTGNPGCISQIKNGAEKFNKDIEVLHPVTLLKRALTWAKA